MTELLKVSALFTLTAVLEIVDGYLPWPVLRQGKPVWCCCRLRWPWHCLPGC